MISTKPTAVALVTALLSSPYCFAFGNGGNVFINGQQLSVNEVAALEMQLGTPIAPGQYVYNYQTGCWANLSNGTSGCLGGAGTYFSRYGSGERNAGGDWSHYSNAAGFGVGGTGDGCIYAGDWSNC